MSSWHLLSVVHVLYVGKHEDEHKEGSKQQSRAPTPAVNEEDGRDRHEHVDGVLNAQTSRLFPFNPAMAKTYLQSH